MNRDDFIDKVNDMLMPYDDFEIMGEDALAWEIVDLFDVYFDVEWDHE